VEVEEMVVHQFLEARVAVEQVLVEQAVEEEVHMVDFVRMGILRKDSPLVLD
jgi:hypothetical protein